MWNGNCLVSVEPSYVAVQAASASRVPQTFVNAYDVTYWGFDIKDEDVRIVSAGPDDNNQYWEAWERILDKAFRVCPDTRKTYYLRMVDDDAWEMTYTHSSREDESDEDSVVFFF